jgi:DNA-binding NtrC family response regulator
MADRILVVDDEANLRKVLGAMLRRDGYEVDTAEDGAEALLMLDDERYAAVLTDLRMPQVDGMAVLRRVMVRSPETPVILLTAHGTVDAAVEALKAGAFDFITKPFDQAELGRILAKAVRTSALAEFESTNLARGDGSGRYGLIGNSPLMHRVFEIIDRVAATPSTVLITGESGTGKELVARALHEHSGRAGRPFIRVNCAAIPEGLIESELFGYEKGAFTGAVASKPGRFELAHGGTLFLDEIGEVSTEMQVKLLRAVQESEFERVGGITTRRVEVRLIAATNRDLAKDVADGKFRDDLYYRLNVVPIALPPLRDRPGDVPALAEHMLGKYMQKLSRKGLERFSDDAMTALQAYPWPGNIRELENVIERTLLFCDGPVIEVKDLPIEFTGRLAGGPAQPPIPPFSGPMGVTALKDVVRWTTQVVERDLIERALAETAGNVTRAARKLEISRKSLQIKMKELGLREPER